MIGKERLEKIVKLVDTFGMKEAMSMLDLSKETLDRYMREWYSLNNHGIRKWLAFGDLHVPSHDMEAIRAMVSFAKDYKPDALLNLGDFCDCESVSHWMKDKRLSLEGKRVQNEIDETLAISDWFDEQLPTVKKKVYCAGNHEEWLKMYVDEHPALHGLIDFEQDLRDRNWEVVPYNTRYKIGYLRAFHGLRVNKHHALATLNDLGVSCIYGHTHDRQEHTISHDDGEKSAQSIGCLCKMNPAYAKNRPKRWVHGFATIDEIIETGEFFIDFVKIIDGKFCRNGKLYRG